MKNPTCESCLYCSRSNATLAFVCRFRSPSAFGDQRFPHVFPMEWCGDGLWKDENGVLLGLIEALEKIEKLAPAKD